MIDAKRRKTAKAGEPQPQLRLLKSSQSKPLTGSFRKFGLYRRCRTALIISRAAGSGHPDCADHLTINGDWNATAKQEELAHRI